MERQTVYLPVVGIDIQLEDGRFEIGNIVFLNMNQERVDEVISSQSSILLATAHTDEEKEKLISIYTQRLQDILTETKKPVCAVFHGIAEPIRAKERAREECYQVFDLFRYALPALSIQLFILCNFHLYRRDRTWSKPAKEPH